MAIPYSVGGWLLVQIAEVVLDAFEAPAWIMQGLLILLLIGFPIAVVLAWVFDITPEHNVVRTGPAEPIPDEEPEEEPAAAISVEMGDSERRQITMLNASFELVHGDDPEDDPEFLRDSISALKTLFRELAEQYEAFPMPSGPEKLVLVFGYPQARDDDARRAVSAGLALIARASDMRNPDSGGPALRHLTQVGISTGLVVVEESAEEGEGVTIIGQAPRMAAWLRGQAGPNAVIVGPHTQRLVSGHFDLSQAAVHEKTQFGDDISVYRVEAAATLDGTVTAPSELMGRGDEMRLLLDRWENVLDGDGQFVILQGEPGIGKSSLLRSFVLHVTESADNLLIPCQCLPHERNNPLAPIIQALQNSIPGFNDPTAEGSRFQKLSAFLERQPGDSGEAAALLASLLSLPTGTDYRPPEGSAQIVRAQTMELLLDMISEAAGRQPVLFVMEDLHWADPSTLEMIQMMVDRGPAAGLFVLFSARPGFKENWITRSFVLVQELLPLPRKSARKLVETTAGDVELPSSLVKRIIEETDGNPLFIRELTLAVLESDAWRKSQELGAKAELSGLEIPATLHDSLAARVDHLGEAKALLQLCSVLGHEFSYELLCKVAGSENLDVLKDELSEIVSAELLFQRGVLKNLTYTFKHILIQETAYNSLLKSKRRELHQRTAEILETEFDDIKERQPSWLAYHYTEAGNREKAIPYWTQASRQSLKGFANQEAAGQAQNGISLLSALPESQERAAAEVPLQSVLGTALLSTHGYTDPRVRKVFTRAHDLCEQIGDAPQLFQVAVGLWMYYTISGQLEEALTLSQRLLRIADATDNPAQLLQARYCQAFVLYYRAEFLAASTLLETAIESEQSDCDYASQSASGDDTRIHVRVLLALVNWHLGLSKTSERLLKEARTIARQVRHPWGRTFAIFHAAYFHQMRGDTQATLRNAEEAIRIAQENGFGFWMPILGNMQAWAVNHENPSPEGVEKMKGALDLYRGIGASAGVTFLMFKLAENYIGVDMFDAAGEVLEEGLRVVRETTEDFFEPEYFRLSGQIALARFRASGEQEAFDQAHRLFGEALASAQKIESKSLELKAACDRAETLAQSERQDEAIVLIDGILLRFDETDDAEDFTRAANLLKKLKK